MMCPKCGKWGGCGGAKKLCPVSFGLALGIVSFFAVLLWTLWVINYGMPPMMVAMHLPVPTMGKGFEHALLVLIKGFLFGFFVALVYDLFACCFARCCRKSGESCECGANRKM